MMKKNILRLVACIAYLVMVFMLRSGSAWKAKASASSDEANFPAFQSNARLAEGRLGNRTSDAVHTERKQANGP